MAYLRYGNNAERAGKFSTRTRALSRPLCSRQAPVNPSKSRGPRAARRAAPRRTDCAKIKTPLLIRRVASFLDFSPRNSLLLRIILSCFPRFSPSLRARKLLYPRMNNCSCLYSIYCSFIFFSASLASTCRNLTKISLLLIIDCSYIAFLIFMRDEDMDLVRTVLECGSFYTILYAILCAALYNLTRFCAPLRIARLARPLRSEIDGEHVISGSGGIICFNSRSHFCFIYISRMMLLR